uniref:Profilin n=1 Tax=Caenorhabditis tropicalis TaxID=1561998 RepID=A0A1I7T4N2_9PELO
MSGWNAYIDTMTASAPAIKRAAIVGAADGSVWARSEDANVFSASEAELKNFVALFDDITNVPAKGADIEGVHYVVPRTEESLIFGKKENTGFFAVKTKSAVLIAVYEGPNEVAAQVRKAVENMQSYLSQAGY